jgi:uncharacterized protein YigE (DUF2233 family)
VQGLIGINNALRFALALTVMASTWACSRSAPKEFQSGVEVVAPGMELRHYRVSSRVSDPTITALYFDPARFELELLTAQRYGSPRTVRRWCEEHDLTAAINASMYLPNLRSTGWMIDDELSNNGAVNPVYGGVLAFHPRHETAPPFRFLSAACGDSIGVVALRDYRTVVQNYRLLDCDGEAIGWRDPKSYSAAAVGQDGRGWIVFVHSGDPCRTSDFSRWLTDERWDLVAAHFVEGGPDASLFARWGHGSVELSGRYAGIGTSQARPVPNVLGVRPRR